MSLNRIINLFRRTGIDIWYADYEPEPQTPYYFTIWQFAEDVAVDGAEGGVDLNIQIFMREADS